MSIKIKYLLSYHKQIEMMKISEHNIFCKVPLSGKSYSLEKIQSTLSERKLHEKMTHSKFYPPPFTLK